MNEQTKIVQDKQKNRRFWALWFSVTVLLLVAVLLTVYLLQNRVKRYEMAHADAAAADIFADLLAETDLPDAKETQTETLYRLLKLDTAIRSSDLQATATYTSQYLSSHTLSYGRTDGRDGAVKYTVSASDTPILSFSLISNHTTGRWELSDAALLLQGPRSIRIRAPMGMTPVVNGELLSDFDIVQTITPQLDAYLPAGVDASALTFRVYACTGLFSVPQVLLQDANGVQYAAAPCADNGDDYYYNTFPASQPLPNGGAELIQAVQAIDLYFAADSSYRQVLDVVIENDASPMYQQLNASDQTQSGNGTALSDIPAHDGVQFSNAVVGNAYWFDASTYLCRIQMTQIFSNLTNGTQQMVQTDRVAVMVDPGDGIFRVYALFDSDLLFVTE